MIKSVGICSVLLLVGISLYARQSDDHILRREFQVTVDNDALFFGSNDKYYSSGIFLKYRRLLRQESRWFQFFNKKQNLSKAIVSYDLVHRMYTSRDIDETLEELVDRPYAGWVNVNFGMSYHFKNDAVLVFDYDLGWLGPATRTEDVQVWWHDTFNMKPPNGWRYQINNTLATNFSVFYQKRLFHAENVFDLIAEQFVQVGTIRNNLRSGLTMRLGNVLGLANSVYTSSKMGGARQKIRDIPTDERTEEFYLYVNATIERVLYNTTIEGNFIGEPSVFTKEALPWVVHQTWGIARSGRYFDYRLAVVLRSREIEDALRHKYITISLVQRF